MSGAVSLSDKSVLYRYVKADLKKDVGSDHKIAVPVIAIDQLKATLGFSLGKEGGNGTIYSVAGPFFPPRVYKIFSEQKLASGDEIRISEIIGRLGIGPTFYGAFSVQNGDKKLVVLEMDNVGKSLGERMGELPVPTREDERPPVEVLTEKLYGSPEAFYCALFSKIMQFAEHNIAHKDGNVGNIIPRLDEEKKGLMLIDYGQAQLASDPKTALRESMNDSYYDFYYRRFENLPNKSEEGNRVLALLKEKLGSTIGQRDKGTYFEFTRRLSPDTLLAISTKWGEIPNIQQQAETLAKQLLENPYSAEIFFDKEIEFIALYGLNKGILDFFDVSNILLFKAACAAYGREQVRVHFLEKKEEREPFYLAASPLFTHRSSYDWDDGKPGPDCAQYRKWLGAPLDKIELPRHQFLFFSTPEDEKLCGDDGYNYLDQNRTIRQRLSEVGTPFLRTEVQGEKRRFLMTNAFFADYFHKLLPKSYAKLNPVLELSALEELRNFSRRDVCVPFSLTPPPEKTDTFPTGSEKNAALNFHTHDLFHMMLDMCNPHLLAFQELNDLVPKKTLLGNDMYEHYLDRQLPAYRNLIGIEGPEAPVGKLFWEQLANVLYYYEDHRQPAIECLKATYKPIIDHIRKNQERWRRDYGITLEALSKQHFYSNSGRALQALASK